MRERKHRQTHARIWSIAIAGSTSISLADALVISGLYGSGALIHGALASAGLLAIQLGVLTVLLSIAGLIHFLFSGRLPGDQSFTAFTLVLVVFSLLANFTFLDYTSDAFGNSGVLASKSAIAVLTISVVTLFVAATRRLFDRQSWITLRSVLKNEHFILAMPFAIAAILVILSGSGAGDG